MHVYLHHKVTQSTSYIDAAEFLPKNCSYNHKAEQFTTQLFDVQCKYFI